MISIKEIAAFNCNQTNVLFINTQLQFWPLLFLQETWYRNAHDEVSGEFPAQRPVTRSFYVFFDLRLA